jgi:hypothetical protein
MTTNLLDFLISTPFPSQTFHGAIQGPPEAHGQGKDYTPLVNTAVWSVAAALLAKELGNKHSLLIGGGVFLGIFIWAKKSVVE